LDIYESLIGPHVICDYVQHTTAGWASSPSTPQTPEDKEDKTIKYMLSHIYQLQQGVV
jgi:hypothetical protein